MSQASSRIRLLRAKCACLFLFTGAFSVACARGATLDEHRVELRDEDGGASSPDASRSGGGRPGGSGGQGSGSASGPNRSGAGGGGNGETDAGFVGSELPIAEGGIDSGRSPDGATTGEGTDAGPDAGGAAGEGGAASEGGSGGIGGEAGAGGAGGTSAADAGNCEPDWSAGWAYQVGDVVINRCTAPEPFLHTCTAGAVHRFRCDPEPGPQAVAWCQEREPGYENGWYAAWEDLGPCE